MERSETVQALDKTKQTTYRTQITKIFNKMEEFPSFDEEKLQSYRNKVLSYKSKLQKVSENVVTDNYNRALAEARDDKAAEKAEQQMLIEHGQSVDYEVKL